MQLLVPALYGLLNLLNWFEFIFASIGISYRQPIFNDLRLKSDLRVRHREECKVVSRLTMENMNLASRCREAIAQVAALKKEIHMYQKRQNEWQTQIQQLQREQNHHNIAGDSGRKKHSRQNSANVDRYVKFELLSVVIAYQLTLTLAILVQLPRI